MILPTEIIYSILLYCDFEQYRELIRSLSRDVYVVATTSKNMRVAFDNYRCLVHSGNTIYTMHGDIKHGEAITEYDDPSLLSQIGTIISRRLEMYRMNVLQSIENIDKNDVVVERVVPSMRCLYHNNGRLYIAQQLCSWKYIGEETEYYPTGVISRVSTPTSIRSYYYDGTLTMHRENNEEIRYSINGNIMAFISIDSNIYRSYYPTGEIYSIGNTDDDYRMHGTITKYDINGTVTGSKTYMRGVRLRDGV